MNRSATGYSRHQSEDQVRDSQGEASASRNGGCEDSARFAKLVLPHLDDAFTLAVWLTDNPVEAEDVVQDACLHAFRAIKSFVGGNARAWILTIVRHRAHMWLRRNR